MAYGRLTALMTACLLALHCGGALAANAAVAAGRGFSIMVDTTQGMAMAVGRNTYGQLGSNSTADSLEPMAVMLPEGERVMKAAAGAFHSLFLTESGKVFSVGRNDYGQLGRESTGLMPMQVMLPEDAVASHIATGYAHSMILAAGELYTFGLNSQGQLGDGTKDNRNMPTPVTLPLNPEDSCTNGTQIRAMAAGYDFSYFVLGDTVYGASCDGMAYAMGNGLGGQLGTGMRDSEIMPTKVAVEGISEVAAGDAHAVFLMKGGSWSATGSNFDGQLGVAGEMFSAMPVDGSVLPDLTSLGAGGDSSCLVGSGKGMAFGSNRMGQLGLGSTTMAPTPTQLEGVVDVSEWSIGEAHSLLMTKELAVWSMGSNTYGQLGDGTTNSSKVAKKVEEFELPSTATATVTETTTVEVTMTQTVTEPAGGVTFTQTGTITQTETMTDTRAGQDAGGAIPPGLTAATIWVASIVVFSMAFLWAVMLQRSGAGDGDVELTQEGQRSVNV